MLYCDLMVTPGFFIPSSDTHRSALAAPLNIISPTASAGRSLPLAEADQRLLPEEFHQQYPSSPMVCQHNTPHCLPFGLCLTVLTFLY